MEQPKHSEALIKGLRALKEGDYARAIEALTEALQTETEVGRVLYSRALARFESGDFQGAIADAKQVISLGADAPEIHLLLGSAYARCDELVPALLAFTRAIEFDKRYADAYYNRGAVYYQQGELEKALVDFGQAIKIRDSAQDYYARGSVALELGELNPARRDFSAALERNPQELGALYKRAQTYWHLRRLPKAEADLRALCQRLPEHRGAQAWLALVLVAQAQANPEQTAKDAEARQVWAGLVAQDMRFRALRWVAASLEWSEAEMGYLRPMLEAL